CGNGVIEGDEECDSTVPSSFGTCGAAGTANACQYICSATVACPTGASCGRDGRCREPNGHFAAAASSPFAFPSRSFQLRDIDGSGAPDLVDTDPLIVAFGAGDGTFPQSASLPGAIVTAIGDVTGSGRAAFAIQTLGPIQIAVAEADRTLTVAPFPTFAV